jgi:hypothetical protein
MYTSGWITSVLDDEKTVNHFQILWTKIKIIIGHWANLIHLSETTEAFIMNVALYKKDGHHLRTSKSIYGKMKPSFYSETTNLTYHKLYINDHRIILNKVYNFYSVQLLIIFKYCGLRFSISRKTHSRNIQYKVSDRVQCYFYPEEFILDSFPHKDVNLEPIIWLKNYREI